MAAAGMAVAACGPSAPQAPTTQQDNKVPGTGATGGGRAASGAGHVSAGNVANLPVGTLVGLDGEPLAVGRDSAGVYAMSLICTHAGCEASVSGQEVVCPCHGSVYDATGNVLSGPAPSPLEHYAVAEDPSGNLTIDTAAVVSPSTRLPV
jgi:cytochrome b6-f complex iron-sulfur subunit